MKAHSESKVPEKVIRHERQVPKRGRVEVERWEEALHPDPCRHCTPLSPT